MLKGAFTLLINFFIYLKIKKRFYLWFFCREIYKVIQVQLGVEIRE